MATRKFGLTLIIAIMVVSSPIIVFISPTTVLGDSNLQSNKVDTSYHHSTLPMSKKESSTNQLSSSLSSNISSSSSLSPATSSSTPTTQAALGGLTARPTNNIVNTNSFYDVVFVTTNPGAIKKILVSFPTGTGVPNSAFLNEVEGIGPGTMRKSGNTLIYTVNNAVNIPSGTKLRIEFSNIMNPSNPGLDYKVTVTTRNTAGAIIDGPTQSVAYPMKRVGNNDIANEAITSSKLSLDSKYVIWGESAAGVSDILFKRNTLSFDPTMDLNDGLGSSPQIAAIGNNVYVVWSNGDDILYRISTDGGATFGRTINLSNNPGILSDKPAIAVSRCETGVLSIRCIQVYVVWQDDAPGNGIDIFYRRSGDGGFNFSGIINLSNNGGDSLEPAIAASGSNVYVVWEDNLASGNLEILYKRSTDSGRTFSVLPARNLSNNAGASEHPAIAAAGKMVYVVWEQSQSASILFRRSTDSGVNFDNTRTLAQSRSTEPAIAASGNNVYVVFIEDIEEGIGSTIEFIRSTNSGLTFASHPFESNIQSEGVHMFPLIVGRDLEPAVAASGNSAYIVWATIEPDAPSPDCCDIFYMGSNNGGSNFGSIINLSNNVGRSSTPQIAVSNNLPQ